MSVETIIYAIMREMSEEVKVNRPLFENVDCVMVKVPDLDEGLKFYQEALGLKMLWRTTTACGLGMKVGVTEFVLSTGNEFEVDLKVEDVEQAVLEFVKAGGKVMFGPFEINIGKCAVVMDPWGNQYSLLDTTKGTCDTDADGIVSGVSKK